MIPPNMLENSILVSATPAKNCSVNIRSFASSSVSFVPSNLHPAIPVLYIQFSLGDVKSTEVDEKTFIF